MANSELYEAGLRLEHKHRGFHSALFSEGALWLLDQIEAGLLKVVPGGDKMFALGYQAGQDSILRQARVLCGREFEQPPAPAEKDEVK
jgi:hypothetical protein